MQMHGKDKSWIKKWEPQKKRFGWILSKIMDLITWRKIWLHVDDFKSGKSCSFCKKNPIYARLFHNIALLFQNHVFYQGLRKRRKQARVKNLPVNQGTGFSPFRSQPRRNLNAIWLRSITCLMLRIQQKFEDHFSAVIFSLIFFRYEFQYDP